MYTYKMNVSMLRRWIIQLSSPIKHAGCLHYSTNCRNLYVSSNLSTRDINFYDFSFKSNNNVNRFSTTSTLLKSKDKFKEKKRTVHVDLNEIAEFVKVERMMSQFDGAIEVFKEQMIKHLGVRTRMGAIEGLSVMFEDEEYALEEVVDISRKPNMVVLNVSAFPQIIPNILDVLTKSRMNLNPQQEGTTIYIMLPKVTKEHRDGLAKTARQYFIKCKDRISDIRNEHTKELKKKENAPTDLVFKAESYINSLQKEYVDKADQLLKAKQKELLGEA